MFLVLTFRASLEGFMRLKTVPFQNGRTPLKFMKNISLSCQTKMIDIIMMCRTHCEAVVIFQCKCTVIGFEVTTTSDVTGRFAHLTGETII